MSMKAILDLDVGDKANVVFDNSGTLAIVGINQVAIYTEIDEENAYFDVPLWNAIQHLIDYIRENAAQFYGVTSPVYFETSPWYPKSEIQNQPNPGGSGFDNLVIVGLGQNAAWTSTSKVGNRIREVREAMWEAKRQYV